MPFLCIAIGVVGFMVAFYLDHIAHQLERIANAQEVIAKDRPRP